MTTRTRYRLLLAAALTLTLSTPAWSGKRHKSYVIQPGDTPSEVAHKFDVPVDQLLRFNGLRPGSFRAGDKIEIPFPGEVTGRTYKVKPGDSVAKVADFHGVSQDDLRAANGMRKHDRLRVGKTIVVPMELRGGATRSHVVRRGDTLASVARRYDVSVKALAAENKLARGGSLQLGRTLLIPEPDDLEPGKAFKPQKVNKLVETGKKVPGGVLHTVQPGQSLWIIARAYNVKGAKIAERNGFDPAEPLAVGTKIVIPGAKEVVPVRVKGYVTQKIKFVRTWNNDTAHLRLLTSKGKVIQSSRKRLSQLASAKTGKRKTRLLHPRLIHMLQRVAERWPGKTIEIVSGYRPRKAGHKVSQHNLARAVDFRVAGVSNKELYEFCKQLPKSGCGYYPNSVFIHMDARERATVWTDRSGKGQRAGAGNAEAEADAVAAGE
jgi:LysM repeat protein